MGYPFEARLVSFSASLAALREAPLRDRGDSFVLSGTGAKFAITFELAWKTMKDAVSGYHGVVDYAVDSPRQTLRAAARLGIIDDDRWMDMLDLRNQLANDYDLSTVRAAFDAITTDYLALFNALKSACSPWRASNPHRRAYAVGTRCGRIRRRGHRERASALLRMS